jgi:hypothetical protein
MNAFRWLCRPVLVALAAIVATAPPSLAERLQPDTFKAYGGTYQSDCRSNTSPKVTLFEDAIVFLQGSKRIAGSNLQASASWFGNSPPDGYLMTFLADTPGGKQVVLTIWEDKSGRYATIDGDPGLIAASVAGKTKFRACGAPGATAERPLTGMAGDAAKGATAGSIEGGNNTLTGTATGGGKGFAGGTAGGTLGGGKGGKDGSGKTSGTGDEEITGSGMIELRPKFKAAYLKALGPRAKTPWLATLGGPSSENRRVKVAGQPYLLVSACKTHDCGDNNVVILWSESRGVIYAMIHEAGKSTHIGKPSPAVAKELGALWRAEYRRQP